MDGDSGGPLAIALGSLLFLGAGIWPTVKFLSEVRLRRRLALTGVSVPGVVTGNVGRTTHHRTAGGTSFAATHAHTCVAYRSMDGAEHRLATRHGRNRAKFAPGSRVTVVHLPEAPRMFRIMEESSDTRAIATFGVLALAAFLIAFTGLITLLTGA